LGGSQNRFQAVPPILVAQICSDERVAPVGLSQRKTLLEGVPIAAGTDDERGMNALRVLASDDTRGQLAKTREHLLSAPNRERLLNPARQSRAHFHATIILERASSSGGFLAGA
jgi:hypothetical protein